MCVCAVSWAYDTQIAWQPQGEAVNSHECEQASVTAGPLLLSVP